MTFGTDQEGVVEGLRGKVKGLEKKFKLKVMHIKVLDRWWSD